MAGRFSVEAVFRAVDRLSAPVSRMQNRVGRFSRSVSRSMNRANRAVNRVAGGLKRIGVAALASMAIVGGAMANVIGVGAKFEQTLVNAAAKFPGEIRRGTEAFKELEDAAKRTGSTTEFTASQAAEALNFLAMAGFNAESAVAALPGVVDLATAAQVDLATATDVASDSLGAFGLMSKDATTLGKNLARVNDVIAKTTTTANTSVELFFETMKDGGAVATGAGASVETFAALTGTLANATIKGSRAGTTLKNIFLSLSAPGKQAADRLRSLGVTTKDSSGNLRDVVDIIEDLNKGLEGMGTADKSGALEEIFGKIPIAGVNILLKEGADNLRAYRSTIEGAAGASSKMANVMRDTLQGRLNSLNSAIEGVKISMFSMTTGPLVDVVEGMTKWVRANEELIAQKFGEYVLWIRDNFTDIVKWIKRIGVGLSVFIAFSAILKTLIGILTIVNLVMAANPIVLITLAIIAAIAAIAAIIYYWDELTAALRETGVAFDLIVAGIGLVTGPIGWLISAALLIYKHWEPIKKFFVDLWNGIGDAFEAGFDYVDEVITKVVDSVKKIIGLIASIGSGVAEFFGFETGATTAVESTAAEARARGAARGAARATSVVSPSDRISRSITESRSTSNSEVTIRDETGRAEVTKGALGSGLKLQKSGAF